MALPMPGLNWYRLCKVGLLAKPCLSHEPRNAVLTFGVLFSGRPSSQTCVTSFWPGICQVSLLLAAEGASPRDAEITDSVVLTAQFLTPLLPLPCLCDLL